jgi:hypothetical protein
MTEEICSCGRPLHYSDPAIQRLVEDLILTQGDLVTIVVAGVGTWRVPRHYIALHGLKAAEIPELARRFTWSRVG